jgi:hypothetical protein
MHADSFHARSAFLMRGAMRFVALLSGLVAPVTLFAADCEVRNLAFQTAQVTCAIGDGAESGVVRLEATFRGFHDDSEIAMDVRVNGAPVVCDPGGRVELSGESGEEGDVALSCRFRMEATGVAGRSVDAQLRFRHADFAGVRLLPEAETKP